MASVNKDDMDKRFWQKVDKRGSTECWIWKGAKKPSGYGNVRRNKVYTTAHRVSWEISFGEIPSGMQVQHSCDNPSCCNPNHLMLGTVISNHIDMIKKNRGNFHHKNRLYGEGHPNHKLSSDEVMNIRGSYIPGVVKQKDLAFEYNVSQRLISLIVRMEARING